MIPMDIMKKMKRVLLYIPIVICLAYGTIPTYAQPEITKPEKKVVKKKTPSKPKFVEKAGYDVTFSCNVPIATMYIDGIVNGTVYGTRFLKTGDHTIKLVAKEYEDYTETIRVNSKNTYFYFSMKKDQREVRKQAILKNLISNMVYVEGGTFMMGATSEQMSDSYSHEEPTHQVTLSSFFIGKYEVTQQEWETVMDSNPSRYKGAKKPVERVSWNDCQEFIRKLNQLTGKEFRLPTEAEWEYADWYDGYSISSNTNPQGANSGSKRVFRGGDYYNPAIFCRVSSRSSHDPDTIRWSVIGLRLALYDKEKEKQIVAQRKTVLKTLMNNMVYVEGGTFTMGATSEQGSDAYSDEKPAHQVTLSSFSIGKYEVTQEEWQAVMGNNPSMFKGARLPVEKVSWADCQKFIKKLNELTGKKFRLPTEAEWEYAARGGKHSKGYKYAGSNNLDSIAWNKENSGGKTHKVGQKKPNELGLYDMSGNVFEWCNDWHGPYGNSFSYTNPQGAYSGTERIERGGDYSNNTTFCRVSCRPKRVPDTRWQIIGFRLAIDGYNSSSFPPNSL